MIFSRNGITDISFELDAGETKKLYLFSDVHFDSVYCDRDLYQKHLEKALLDNAFILDGGDFFDAMQGRVDPRRSMEDLRPEYRRDDYYDYVVKDAANFLQKYSKNIVLLTPGNHELGVLKYANTLLTDRLAGELRSFGSQVATGWFKGWIRLKWKYTKGKDNGTILIRHSHSGGGGLSPVTRGILEINRQAVYLPDADIVWNGHNHQGWIHPIARERISAKGTLYKDLLWFVRTPGYKTEYLLSGNGFEAQNVSGPTPTGCIVITIQYNKAEIKINAEPLFG